MTKKGIDLNSLIEMIGSMASLKFSKRLDVEVNDDPINVIAYGLNMLSEELEANTVKRSLLEETNANLERFSYTVAHDIKSPLNSALALMSLIDAELEVNKNDTVKEYFSLLKDTYLRTTQMVDGILEYSRTNFNNIQVSEINLDKICSDIALEYSLQGSSVTILCGSMPCVQHNELALRQILHNLIGNAIKYSDKEECIISISCADKDTCFELSVKDNGPGIPAEYLDKVFDLFENFHTDRRDSHGIGLSIVKKLVTQAGGAVWIESQAGQGAKFTFTIQK